MPAKERRLAAPEPEPAVPDIADHPALASADPRLAPGFIHAVHPDHGEPVTIQPGELTPGWMADQLAAGASLTVEASGVFTLAKGGKR
jgi:hypothetical protein